MTTSGDIRRKIFELDVAIKKELGGYLYPNTDIMVNIYHHSDKNTIVYKFSDDTDNSGIMGWYSLSDIMNSSPEFVVTNIVELFMRWTD